MLPDAVLDDVGKVRDAVATQRQDPDSLRVERFANLVADEIEDGLDVELRGEARLHAVDDVELVGALFQQRVGCRQLESCAARLSVRGPSTTARCRVRLPPGSQAGPTCPESVSSKRPSETVHVDVQVTEQTSLDNQRRDDARTLPLARRRDRRVHEFRSARSGGARQV